MGRPHPRKTRRCQRWSAILYVSVRVSFFCLDDILRSPSQRPRRGLVHTAHRGRHRVRHLLPQGPGRKVHRNTARIKRREGDPRVLERRDRGRSPRPRQGARQAREPPTPPRGQRRRPERRFLRCPGRHPQNVPRCVDSANVGKPVQRRENLSYTSERCAYRRPLALFRTLSGAAACVDTAP